MKSRYIPLQLFRILLLCALTHALFVSDISLRTCRGAEKTGSHAATVRQANELTDQGAEAFRKGNFAESVLLWEKAANLYASEDKTLEQMDALSRMAEAYQSMGHYQKAKEIIIGAANPLIQEVDDPKCLDMLRWCLGQHSTFPDQSGHHCLNTDMPVDDRMRLAMIMGILGQICQFTGEVDRAEHCLHTGLEMIKKTECPDLTASILNSFGNLYTAKGDHDGAILAYEECAELAMQAGNPTLRIKSMISAARVCYEKKEYHRVLTLSHTALNTLRELDDIHDKAYGLIAVGQLLNRVRHLGGNSERSDVELMQLAYDAFKNAEGVAKRSNDRIAESYALGELGNLYEAEGRHEDALYFTRRAVFAAQEVNETKSLYRWHWQTGRLLREQGDIDAAIAAYLRSAKCLETIRNHLSEDCRNRNIRLSFRDAVGPIYFELADLLLRRGADGDLLDARDAIEQLKAVELQDYFQDACVTAIQKKIARIDQIISQHTAAVYPILFPDRTELLVNLSDGLRHVTVPVGEKRLVPEVKKFRTQLQEKNSAYLQGAQTIYNWLIRPLEDELDAHQIDTLIFIPDGELRTIPMGALHDGERFLVSKYAMAVVPGLDLLTAPRSLRHEKRFRVLLNGLTMSVQGFSPLPNVSAELDVIQRLFCRCNIRKDCCGILKDDAFTLSAVADELKRNLYSVVHIASHGQFKGDPEDTFLLTYDGRITFDKLDEFMGSSRFREDPVMLLTLSACETAAGDERAALGLAGVAIKAGVRSALATLWPVYDESTYRLMADFYQAFLDASVSKAKALQTAQTNLMKTKKHPAHWAPFLLIGDWM